jgi:hypothetical protein
MDHVRPLNSIQQADESRSRIAARPENPWPLEVGNKESKR